MRRITFAFMSTLAAVVLLFSYRTSTNATSPASSTVGSGAQVPGIVAGASPDPSPPATGSASTGTSASPSPSATAAAKPSNLVVNGSVAQTRWGPVQVQVTIAGGKITNVTALQQPTGNGRDQEINDYALPILHDEAVQAQSARVDAVSGATVTSGGYIESLQSALDIAQFG
jgi:uncharacterized protein with FMN-binding domain